MTHAGLPGGVADLLGHRDVIRRLWDALTRDTLHHAYLFEGPEGVGKRTVALRLAMAANCDGPGSPLPCGRCRACTTIAAGTHPDVLLLEPDPQKATRIITVDQVRELVRQSGYHRFSARKRFVIVDPAEAMQDSAANALLKTLEEPPEGTHFLLIANHARGLLPTIVSRCQRQRFSAVAVQELAPWLQARGIEHAEQLAATAMGCPGRALELAEGGQLEERRQLRDSLLVAMGGGLEDVYAWTSKVATGDPPVWRERVGTVLDIVDELLRDTTILGAGATPPLLHSDRAVTIAAWARVLYPQGVSVCAAAVVEARDQLALNVSGRTLLDALLATVASQLGSARRV